MEDNDMNGNRAGDVAADPAVNPAVDPAFDPAVGPAVAPRATFAHRVWRLLLRGPGELRSHRAGAAAGLLAIAGAAAGIWSGVLHLQLWSDGYQEIPVIGPLFLVQGAGSILIAIVLALFRRLVLMAAGTVTLVATAVGLLVSVYAGLFGYRESLAVPYAKESLVVEFAGAALLIAAMILVLALPGTVPGTGAGHAVRADKRTGRLFRDSRRR